MRTLTAFGILLIVLGICALLFQSITFFTNDRVVDAGPLQIDWQKPHTIIINPIVGVAALLGGVALMIAGRRPETT